MGDRPKRWIKQGYVRLDSGLEHRLVMERFLGGELPEGALVHHRNRRRADNLETNLLLVPNDLIHRTLHEAMRSCDARRIDEIELSCEGWADLIQEHYAAGRKGPLPPYSGYLRPKPKPLLELQPERSNSGNRRFIVRPRLSRS